MSPLLVEHTPVGAPVLCASKAGAFAAQAMQLLDELAGDMLFALDYLTKAEQLEYLTYSRSCETSLSIKTVA